MVFAACLAPLNGDLVSPSWASGGPWVRGKEEGGPFASLPGQWYLDVGSRYWNHWDSARRKLPVKYSGSDDEGMDRTRFGLVGGKQGLRDGDEGGGCVVCGFVEVAG